MKRLIECGKNFLKQMDLCDMALLKFCLLALGLMVGLGIPKTKKKPVLAGALFVFIATYLPLMGKLIGIASRQPKRGPKVQPVEAAHMG